MGASVNVDHTSADFDPAISFFPHYSSQPSRTTLSQAVAAVRSGEYKERIEALQHTLATQGKKAYDAAKKQLPSWTFGAVMETRSKTPGMKPSGVICLDLDEDEDALGTLATAAADPHVIAAFRSPSYRGVKAVVKLAKIPRLRPDDRLIDVQYQHAYETAAQHFAELWGINVNFDGQCKDIGRLCFVSHDPEAHYNPNAEGFDWNLAAIHVAAQDAPHALCRFTHGDHTHIDIAEATQGELRYLNDEMHYTNGIPVWKPAGTKVIVGVMANAGACYDCRKERTEQVILAIERRDRGKELNRFATFWVPDDHTQELEVWRVGEGAARARFKPATPDDHLRFMPRITLPHPDSVEWDRIRKTLPEIVQTELCHAQGMPPEDVAWIQRLFSRALDAPQRQGFLIAGWPHTGKSTLYKAVYKGMPKGAVQGIHGKNFDRYVGEKLMRAVFLFAEDAHNIKDDGWDTAQSLSGGNPAAVRGMRLLDDTEESQSTLLMLSEARFTKFKARNQKGTGWDDRLAYIVNPKPDEAHRQNPKVAERLLSPENVQALMMWMIDGLNSTDEADTRPTERMAAFADEVHAAARASAKEEGDPGFAIRDEDGNPIEPGQEALDDDAVRCCNDQLIFEERAVCDWEELATRYRKLYLDKRGLADEDKRKLEAAARAAGAYIDVRGSKRVLVNARLAGE